MQPPVLNRLGRMALDLLYPPRCVLCGAGGTFLCRPCTEALPATDGDRCERCWLPLRWVQCRSCHQHPSLLTSLRSAMRYEGNARHLVHKFKFGGQSALAESLGNLLASAYARYALDADLIVPVPLTASRRRIRGFNQALLLANEVSKHTGVPVAEALRRTGHGNTQAGSASAEERRRNVQDVFGISKGANPTGAHVLLIDDVATTGATLNACAAVLLEAGATSVSGLTLARED